MKLNNFGKYFKTYAEAFKQQIQRESKVLKLIQQKKSEEK